MRPSTARIVEVVRFLLSTLTMLANRDPHGTTTPCYVRPFTARIVEVVRFRSQLSTISHAFGKTKKIRRNHAVAPNLVYKASIYYLTTFLLFII